MLNFKIAMLALVNETRVFLLLISLLAWLQPLVFRAVPHFQGSEVEIDAPLGGDALQGVVSIVGSTDLPGFRSVEVAFAYQSDSTGTWFLIQQGSKPVHRDVLTSWDTTTITDGEYRLRVRVTLDDGKTVETVISGLRVRNYTPIEVSTPEANTNQVLATATPTPWQDFQVTPRTVKLAPTNPVELRGSDLQSSALNGVGAVIGALLIAGIYLGIRAAVRR